MKQYKVAVVTGTRAEYGLLSRVIKRIEEEETLQLLLVVTGSHLSEAHGNTVQEIEKDGVPIYAKIPILQFENTPLGTAETTGFAVSAFAKWFEKETPDVVLILGDRYEIFAAATAAAILDIPVAHISGGDVTLGAQDEFFRHAVSKMAKLHFPSNEESAARLLRMGEEPFRVHNVGGLGDENIRALQPMPKEELEKSIGFCLQLPFALVTFHPETVQENENNVPPKAQMQALLQAFNAFPNLTLLFTKANADAGGNEINELIDQYCAGRENAFAVPSLGLVRYLSAMQYCSVVVGNSSSGVVETPTFGVPTVDIGNRQAGRHRSANIVHCEANEAAIINALQTACSPTFAQTAKTAVSIYNGGDTSERIVSILKEWLTQNTFTIPKHFFDGGL